MKQVKSTDTRPEMLVRKSIHRAGFRFRLHDARLPGKPDLVFPRYKIAVFVHGCFWHWHGCKRSRMPAQNRDYWETKIQRNVDRDKATRLALQEKGWTWMYIWECSLDEGIETLLNLLQERRALHS